MSFFTIEIFYQNRRGYLTNIYLTFKLINDKFYLYQYSKEEGYVGDDEDDAMHTCIYYCQVRDDPQKKRKTYTFRLC